MLIPLIISLVLSILTLSVLDTEPFGSVGGFLSKIGFQFVQSPVKLSICAYITAPDTVEKPGSNRIYCGALISTLAPLSIVKFPCGTLASGLTWKPACGSSTAHDN